MAYRSFQEATITRRALFRSSAYVAAGASIASLPFSSPLFAHDVSESYPNVAALAKRYVDERKVANVLATFGWGEQPHAHQVGYGTLALGSTVEVNQDSLYRIYSMTKPITGMCAMALIEDGLLELDQPLYDILPAWRDMMVQVEYDGAISEDNLEPAKSPVTIRQLLTHTAGIGYGIIQQGPISQAFMEKGLIPGQVSRLPIPGLDRGNPVESLEAFADGMAAMPLVYQPGTKWSYSAGLDVLGRAIEVAEGKPFDQVMHDRIFGPCGMESTWFQVPASERTRLTTNYGVDENGPQPIDPAAISIYLDKPPFPMGGAGLVSSPRDYDRFLNMLLNYGKLDGKQVFPEAAVRKGTSNILPETVDLTGSWTEGQGFGAGGRVVDGSFGWGGAAGTLAAVSYKYGLRTGLFTQYMESGAYPLRDEYMAALEADLAAMAAARQAA